MDGSVMDSGETMARTYQLGAEWDGADILIGNTGAIWLLDHPDGTRLHAFSYEFLISIAQKTQKPMVIFVNAGDTTTEWRAGALLKAQDKCREAGIPVYPNVQRAARALAHFTRYHRRRESMTC
jgi:acyl-CoA synthetase (NDP forming)